MIKAIEASEAFERLMRGYYFDDRELIKDVNLIRDYFEQEIYKEKE